MRSALTVTLTVVLLSGCTFRHGEWLDTYPQARGPEGLATELDVEGLDGELKSELLAVEEEGLLVRFQETLYHVPYGKITRAEFPTAADRLGFGGGRAPAPEIREVLRLHSRFPQGVDDDLLARLLAAYEQDAVVELGAGSGEHGAHEAGAPGPEGPHSARAAQPAHAEPAHAEPVEPFVAAVREATARFRDRSVAIHEGYRKLGPDFPAMGEHWIQPGLVIEGATDPARPPVLTYATFEGRVTLTGVAYTLPLAPGEEPPPFLGRTDVWHDHSSRVDEESLLLNHRGRHPGAEASRGPRLAMVHVWAWTENPHGVLAQHNRALPFRRVGVPVPAGASPPAVRALSLAGSGAVYYEALLEAAVDPASGEGARFREALEAHRGRVEAWVEEARDARAAGVDGPPDPAPLAAIWGSLWRELEEGCEPATRERLAELRAALEG